MIDVKETAKLAVEYLKDLYDITQFQDILLEEVALSDDEKSWFVTLGFSRPAFTPPKTFADTISVKPSTYRREYKIFQIDSATGKIKSMKIRDV